MQAASRSARAFDVQGASVRAGGLWEVRVRVPAVAYSSSAQGRRWCHVDALRAVDPPVLLELPLKGNPQMARTLVDSGAFGGLLSVDLPDPGRDVRERGGGVGVGRGELVHGLPTVSGTAACRWGAPTGDLRRRLRECAAAGDVAWLLFGGDTDKWRNPAPRHPDVYDLMEEAAVVGRELRARGAAAPELWCVANPLDGRPGAELARLQAKVAAGARAVLTQPAHLLPLRALRFWDRASEAQFSCGDVQQRGLGRSVPAVAAIAVPSGPTAVARLLTACGIGDRDPEALELMQRWRQAEAGSAGKYAVFRQGELQRAVEWAWRRPGVAGLLLQPADDRGAADLAAYVAEGGALSPANVSQTARSTAGVV